jgi:putative NADH-flavin reductase
LGRKLIVFGATGATGQQLVQQALAGGYAVTAFVRDPGKLIARHANLRIMQGDLADTESIDAALAQGGDAVMLALGMYSSRPTTELSEGTRKIISAMQRHGIPRLLAVSSLGVGNSAGHGNFIVRLIQKTTLKHVLADKERQEQAIRDSGLDWTVVRPPRLMNKAEICEELLVWRDNPPGSGVKWETSTASVAHLLLEAFAGQRYIREAINIADPKGR